MSCDVTCISRLFLDFALEDEAEVDEIPVVNFTNILQAAFAPISLRQKVQT